MLPFALDLYVAAAICWRKELTAVAFQVEAQRLDAEEVLSGYRTSGNMYQILQKQTRDKQKMQYVKYLLKVGKHTFKQIPNPLAKHQAQQVLCS